MLLKNISFEELEIMSYTDITYMYLKEVNSSINTATLFKKICELLEMSDDDFVNKIGDYYTSLVIDKRFKLLNSNEWDLSEKHKAEIEHEDDDEDLDADLELDDEDETLEDEYDDDDHDDAELDEDELEEGEDFSDDDDENFRGLSIIDEDELEE